jgi:hypothetical protein
MKTILIIIVAVLLAAFIFWYNSNARQYERGERYRVAVYENGNGKKFYQIEELKRGWFSGDYNWRNMSVFNYRTSTPENITFDNEAEADSVCNWLLNNVFVKQ